MIQPLKLTVMALIIISTAAIAPAQTRNLLANPGADLNTEGWHTSGEAAVEIAPDGNSHFIVRRGGFFYQDVALPADAAGQYVLLLGRGTNTRTNFSRSITGLPYLYGYLMTERKPGGSILEYLQGQHMLGEGRNSEWIRMWGIFRVPATARSVRFFLNQALSKDVPYDDSAARFDDVGLYLFPSRESAQAFLDSFQ